MGVIDDLLFKIPASLKGLLLCGLIVFLSSWLLRVRYKNKDKVSVAQSFLIAIMCLVSLVLITHLERINPKELPLDAIKPKKPIQYGFFNKKHTLLSNDGSNSANTE